MKRIAMIDHFAKFPWKRNGATIESPEEQEKMWQHRIDGWRTVLAVLTDWFTT